MWVKVSDLTHGRKVRPDDTVVYHINLVLIFSSVILSILIETHEILILWDQRSNLLWGSVET